MSQHIQYTPNSNYYPRYNQSWINATLRLIKTFVNPSKLLKKPKVLDIGCGRGEILRDLSKSGYDCFGVDFDEECVKMSSAYAKVIHSDVTAMDEIFENDFFDIVVMVHILEHTINPSEVIEKAKSITNKFIVIAVPNLSSSSTFWHGVRMREPTFVNRGHRFGWDSCHFKTFLEEICRLKIIKWMPDRVIIPSRLALPFQGTRILENLELRILPRYFPLLSNSLIVLCEKARRL